MIGLVFLGGALVIENEHNHQFDGCVLTILRNNGLEGLIFNKNNH